MERSQPDNDIAQSLAALQADGNALPWTQRRQLAITLGHALAQGRHDGDAFTLAGVLAKDSRPEVRKEIAEALIHLPHEECMRLGAMLAEDSNSLVAKAAHRALGRRQRAADQAQRVTRKLNRVRSQYEVMEQKYGRAITADARRLASEQYDTLVGDTIHNLNNIVTPVRLKIATLKRQYQDDRDPALLRTLTEMERQMAYLAHFMNEMREYAKASAIPRQPELVGDIIAEANRYARETCASNGTAIDGVEVVISVPETLTFCLARCQMVSALVHVLRNAYECFSPRAKHPKIEIAADVVDSQLLITVQDNGPGIDADSLAVLRDFVPRRITTKATGTGFGLPTAWRYIVEGHDGSLSLESAPRKGTQVTIIIPEARNEEVPA